jgi:hypothetical protein
LGVVLASVDPLFLQRVAAEGQIGLGCDMADILSISKARKAKARAQKEQQASENRIKFGRTKAERQREVAERDRAERTTDAHKREE